MLDFVEILLLEAFLNVLLELSSLNTPLGTIPVAASAKTIFAAILSRSIARERALRTFLFANIFSPFISAFSLSI
jgi:hypothetical protein